MIFSLPAGNSRRRRRLKKPGAPAPGFTGVWGRSATNKHAPGIYRRIACRYYLQAILRFAFLIAAVPTDRRKGARRTPYKIEHDWHGSTMAPLYTWQAYAGFFPLSSPFLLHSSLYCEKGVAFFCRYAIVTSLSECPAICGERGNRVRIPNDPVTVNGQSFAQCHCRTGEKAHLDA